MFLACVFLLNFLLHFSSLVENVLYLKKYKSNKMCVTGNLWETDVCLCNSIEFTHERFVFNFDGSHANT